MHRFRSALVLATALAGSASTAVAGTLGAFDFSNAPGAETTVAAIADEVTYAKVGESLKTFVAFNVGSGAYLMKNISGNTINNATISFIAKVTDTNEKLKLFDTNTYLSGLPGCSIPNAAANPLVFSCQVRQFKAGDSFPAFTVFYEAPGKVVGGDGDPVGSDKVTLDIKLVYSERDNGGNPLPNSTLEKLMDLADAVTLGTDNPTYVRSAVPKSSGSTLFTGVGAVATATDPWTTTVVIPPDFVAPTGTYTTAEILELVTDVATPDCTIAANLFTCSASQLVIPGTFPPRLVIYLRRDASTLANPNRANDIDSAKIFYASPEHPAAGVTYPLDVPACTDTTYGGPLPKVGIPCIKNRTRYGNSSPVEWRKDWEFEVWALENGRYIN